MMVNKVLNCGRGCSCLVFSIIADQLRKNDVDAAVIMIVMRFWRLSKSKPRGPDCSSDPDLKP